MDRLIAFEEVVASEAIEFVDSSNVVFFLPAETDGVLYVGFSDSFLPESDPAPLATTEYFGATSWGVRLYAYSNISAEQIEVRRIPSARRDFSRASESPRWA